MSSYSYQKLPDPRVWIRLLRLRPGLESSDLEASLEIVRVRDKPYYEALSYCWGAKEMPRNLLLRDQGQEHLIPITKNLDLALKRMRDSFLDRVIWTDAICINQKDGDEEKSHQVRIMDKIYAAAAKVLVYLGGLEDFPPQAEALLQKIHTSAINSSTAQQSALDWVRDSRLPSANEHASWEPVKTFFRLPWFRRKWTIQESALVSKLDFHCGSWRCDWDWMCLVIETIYNKGLGVQDYTTYTDEKEAQHLQQGLSQINSIRLFRQGMLMGNTYGLLDLAYHFQVSEATDERDHLYALLGMSADTDDKQLDPKYRSFTLLQNCLRYAYHFLHQNRNLEVLYRAGLTDHKLLAPSWIPNWYGGRQNFGSERNEGFWNPLLRPRHLHVARCTSVSITSSRDSPVLGLVGVVIDGVKELANDCLTATRDSIWRSKTLMLTRRRLHLLETDRMLRQLVVYPTGQALEDVQWRTLMCNTTRGGTIPDDGFRDVFAAWRRVTTLVAPTSPDQKRADFRAAEPFDRVIGGWNNDKIFGLTTEGFVGMFPHQARKDDEIAVLHGGEFPFVLRPCGKSQTSNYELVGQCYIHGIMEEGQLDLQKFKSREREILLV